MARITIEDCLEHVPNRFALVLVAAERTKQLMRGSPTLVQDHRDNKEIVMSLREIAAERVHYVKKEVEEYDPTTEAEIRRASQSKQYGHQSDGKPAEESDFEAELDKAKLDSEFSDATDLDKLFSKLDNPSS